MKLYPSNEQYYYDSDQSTLSWASVSPEISPSDQKIMGIIILNHGAVTATLFSRMKSPKSHRLGNKWQILKIYDICLTAVAAMLGKGLLNF